MDVVSLSAVQVTEDQIKVAGLHSLYPVKFVVTTIGSGQENPLISAALLECFYIGVN